MIIGLEGMEDFELEMVSLEGELELSVGPAFHRDSMIMMYRVVLYPEPSPELPVRHSTPPPLLRERRWSTSCGVHDERTPELAVAYCDLTTSIDEEVVVFTHFSDSPGPFGGSGQPAPTHGRCLAVRVTRLRPPLDQALATTLSRGDLSRVTLGSRDRCHRRGGPLALQVRTFLGRAWHGPPVGLLRLRRASGSLYD